MQIAGILACSERQTGRFVHQHPILGTRKTCCRFFVILRCMAYLSIASS